MPSRPWMPLHIGDYLGDTGHLTNAQHGTVQPWVTGTILFQSRPQKPCRTSGTKCRYDRGTIGEKAAIDGHFLVVPPVRSRLRPSSPRRGS
jgi:hypothetical protein